MSEESVIPENIVELNLNSVLAGIVKALNGVSVPIDYILADYQNQSLAVSFDEDNRTLELSLVDNTELDVENES